MGMFKKLKTVLESGLEPIEQGMENFENRSLEIERIAEKRAAVCGTCDKNVKEPIAFFRVKDDTLPAVSERMCDSCGCALPLLVRQNVKICKKWKE